MKARAVKVYSNSDKRLQRSDKIKTEAEASKIDIEDITARIQEAIIDLNNYGSNDQHIKLPAALREAQMYLKDIKHRSKNLPAVEDSHNCANDQYEFWADEFLNANIQKKKISNFVILRDLFSERMDDLKNLTHRAFRDSSETEAFITKNRKNFEKLKEKFQMIKESYNEIDPYLDHKILENADSMMAKIHENIANLKFQNGELINLNENVKSSLNDVGQELQDVADDKIPRAQDHAEDLAKRSKVIVDLFQHSKDGAKVAMLAGTAHKNIIEAIDSARVASQKAYEAAISSNNELNPIDEETILEKGLDSLQESSYIQEDALNEISKIESKFQIFLHNFKIIFNQFFNQIQILRKCSIIKKISYRI